MPQTATIKSLPVAFEMLKAMQAEGVEWGEDYRASARQALAELLEGRMAETIDRHLARMGERDQADRRNGCYTRWLLTELGMIELHVPRTRTRSALKVVRAYVRRAKNVDRMILACFVLGLSTRKVAMALLPVLGRPVSPTTVSAVAKQLDAAVAAFHRRPLQDVYRVLVLDGVVLRRKTGAGARPPRAGRSRPAPRRQERGHRLPPGERRERRAVGAIPRRSDPAWADRRAARDALRRRRCRPARRLAHSLPRYPGPTLLGAQDPQRARQGPPRADQAAIKADLHRIHERHDPAGRLARRFAARSEQDYPKAVACLRADLAIS